MHSKTIVGSFVALITTLTASQALSVGYTLEATNSVGDCKKIDDFQADFEAVNKNIPKPADGSAIVVRMSSPYECQVFSDAIHALDTSGISGIRLWFDYMVPTDPVNGSPSNVALNGALLAVIVDDIRVAILYGNVCQYLSGITFEHYGNLKSADISEALSALRVQTGLGSGQGACQGVKTTFKTSVNAWLTQYTAVAKEVSQIEFPYGVASEETDVHALTASLLDTVDRLKKTFSQMSIVVAGTGWPSPSITNEQRYWQQFWCKAGDWASKDTVKAVFWNSVFGSRKTNGLLNKDGTPKFPLKRC